MGACLVGTDFKELHICVLSFANSMANTKNIKTLLFILTGLKSTREAEGASDFLYG